MIPVLPAGWTTDDIQFLIEKVKGWPIVLVDDQALGIPTTQSIPSEAISDWGYGVLEAETEKYTVLYEIIQTPSGKGWAHVCDFGMLPVQQGSRTRAPRKSRRNSCRKC